MNWQHRRITVQGGIGKRESYTNSKRLGSFIELLLCLEPIGILGYGQKIWDTSSTTASLKRFPTFPTPAREPWRDSQHQEPKKKRIVRNMYSIHLCSSTQFSLLSVCLFNNPSYENIIPWYLVEPSGNVPGVHPDANSVSIDIDVSIFVEHKLLKREILVQALRD